MISKTFQHGLIGLGGIVIINIGLASQWIPAPTPKSTTQPVTDNWRNLELEQPVNYQVLIETIRQKKAWREPPSSATAQAAGASGAPIKPAEPPKPEIVRDWQVRGIVKEGKTRFALISLVIDKQPKINRYAQSDVLPDGSVIEKIDDNRVEIVQNGTPEIICLYLQNPSKK
jgi:hypothetical protein